MKLKQIYVPKINKSGPYPKPILYYIDNNDCWICISHRKDKDGYPMIRTSLKHQSMSRYIYSLYNGRISAGMCIRHTCDNPSCINPQHLLIGTYQDNSNDMIIRGRQCLQDGEHSHGAKLNNQKVREIRKLYPHKTFQSIAYIYGVSRQCVADIIQGKTWKNA